MAARAFTCRSLPRLRLIPEIRFFPVVEVLVLGLFSYGSFQVQGFLRGSPYSRDDRILGRVFGASRLGQPHVVGLEEIRPVHGFGVDRLGLSRLMQYCSLNEYQYGCPKFLVQLLYRVPQIDLKMMLCDYPGPYTAFQQ